MGVYVGTYGCACMRMYVYECVCVCVCVCVCGGLLFVFFFQVAFSDCSCTPFVER
jgi:hypothetical protein